MAYGNTVGDGSGTYLHLLVDADGRLIMDAGWAASLESDEDADNSAKTFTVPANTEWEIQSVWVELTATADAGDRQMAIDILDDSADVIAQIRAGIVQVAEAVRYYLFSPDVVELEAFRDTDYLSTLIPRWCLPAGYAIKVWDKDEIQAAADDMVVQMMIKSRSVP